MMADTSKVRSWVQLIIQALVVAGAVFASYYSLSGDVRSVTESLRRAQQDIVDMRTEIKSVKDLIPPREVYDTRIGQLEKQVTEMKSSLEREISELKEATRFNTERAQSFREFLLSKGVLDNNRQKDE